MVLFEVIQAGFGVEVAQQFCVPGHDCRAEQKQKAVVNHQSCLALHVVIQVEDDKASKKGS